MWIYGSIVFLCCLTVQGEEDCDPGKYGDGCNQNCSQNCEPLPNGMVLCHKETGECLEGCKAGVYGDQCDEPCSKRCLGNTCYQHNGHCTRGCIDNHIGDFCEIYNGITIVHQGTTHSSHTTVATGVAPTSSSQVVIPDVVTILILILILILIRVGAVIIFIWRRKKEVKEKKMKKESDPEDQQTFIPEEKDVSDKEMADYQKSMDKDHEYNSEDERTDSDSDGEEDMGRPVKLITDFVKDPREQDVTLHVKVMKVGEVEEKSNKKQFMATVADATSAVDICVREEKLFDKFKPKESIILRNVIWTGRVLFTKFSSTATFAAEVRVQENIITEAFGEGEPVPISEVLELPDLIRISLTGKIVKQSPLTKRKCYEKVLSYRHVKLNDGTGSVYVDVWGDITEQMQQGMVCTVNSCRKRQPRMPLDPWFTTTPKSTVMYLHSSELRHIREDRYQRGTLVGIDVTPYMSCPTPRCVRFQLTDGLCESCQCQIPDQDQVSYGMANIDILTQKGNIHSLTAYWQELSQLFRLFKKKIPPESDKEKIVKSFKDLMNKSVKYQACGIVSKFKL